MVENWFAGPSKLLNPANSENLTSWIKKFAGLGACFFWLMHALKSAACFCVGVLQSVPCVVLAAVVDEMMCDCIIVS